MQLKHALKKTPTLAVLILAGVAIGLGLFLQRSPFSRPVSVPNSPLCSKCNIILISIDTLRADDLPCYGYPHNTAPNLCAFANKNVLFTKTYSQGPYTLPSYFSVVTSLYPSHHHMLRPLVDSLNPEIMTLPQLLQAHGYETIYIGPDDDLNLPLDKGVGRGFLSIIPNRLTESWEKGYQKLRENTKLGKLTFLFLHSYNGHGPYFFTKREKRMFTSDDYLNIPYVYQENESFNTDFVQFIMQKFRERLDQGGTPESLKRDREIYEQLLYAKNLDEAKKVFNSLPDMEKGSLYHDRYFRYVDPQNSRQMRFLKALYDEKIFQLDQELAKFFSFLAEKDIQKSTIVIIYSNHGEEFGEHGQLEHGHNIYNTNTFVPLIISAPRLGGRQVEELVQLIDIYPTILSMIGVRKPSWLEGLDLTDLAMGRLVSPVNQYVFSERSLSDEKGNVLLERSIQDKQWKLYLKDSINGIKSIELYNYQEDSLEQHNLEAVNPGVTRVLLRNLENTLNKKPVFSKIENPFPAWIDNLKRKKIINEGYF